jgi:hypothetical protein
MATNNDGIIYFNFGTNKLNNVLLANITGSFGGTHTNKMFSFGSNATTYPGIINWIVNSFTSGTTTTPSKYYIDNNQLIWGYACNNSTNSGPLKSGICTTKITFIINQPTIIYLNTCCIDNNGGNIYSLTMGKSYFTLQLISNTPPTNIIWTITSAPSPNNWKGISSDSTGSKLAAVVYGGGIYYSSNSGVNWTKSDASNNNWEVITSSSDGTKLAAIVSGGGIYKSLNSGVNWTLGLILSGGAINNSWTDIASSSDGTILVAVNYYNLNYRSTDSGTSWNPMSAPSSQDWQAISSSSDGTKLAIVSGTGTGVGNIYWSNNSGNNWNISNSASGNYWVGIASSSDGSRLAAIVSGGYIWTSSDYGATWSTNNNSSGSRQWRDITSSSDGTKLAAVVNGGGIWASSNSGVNWTQTNAPSETWQAIASSSDGIKAAAVNTTTPIYTGTYTY